MLEVTSYFKEMENMSFH